MKIQAQRERAGIFSQMHKKKGMFVIPNAWDAASAYIFEREGFEAVATTSAGIAYSLGYCDGQEITIDDLEYAVGKMADRISVPLSVDVERGYGETGRQVKENIRRLLRAGASGFNLEDGQSDGALSPVELQIEKIRAIAELKEETGIDFVINARTCAYWLDVAGEEEKFEIACQRGNAFAQAGADCVFVPGAIGEETVKKLAENIEAPLNIILNGKFNDLKKLEKAGVRRWSTGSGPARYIYGNTVEIARELRCGKPEQILSGWLSYNEANEYFKDQI